MADGELRKLVQANIKGPHWQAIETGGTGRGIPDLEGCWQGVSVWIEMKLTGGYTAGLRPEQIGWIHRRSRAGGRVFVMVRRKWAEGFRRGPAGDEVWLIEGQWVELLAEGGLKEVEKQGLVRYKGSGGPKNWHWERIMFEIFGTSADFHADGGSARNILASRSPFVDPDAVEST